MHLPLPRLPGDAFLIKFVTNKCASLSENEIGRIDFLSMRFEGMFRAGNGSILKILQWNNLRMWFFGGACIPWFRRKLFPYWLALSRVAILHVQGDNFYSLKPVNFVNIFHFVCGKANQYDNLNSQSRVKFLSFIIFKFIPQKCRPKENTRERSVVIACVAHTGLSQLESDLSLQGKRTLSGNLAC